MRVRGRQKPLRPRTRRASRPYLIDPEDFEFMDDNEMFDWMFASGSAPQ